MIYSIIKEHQISMPGMKRALSLRKSILVPDHLKLVKQGTSELTKLGDDMKN